LSDFYILIRWNTIQGLNFYHLLFSVKLISLWHPMQLSYNRKKYSCQSEETVLQALLRQNVNIPNGCGHQVCLSCLMVSLDGSPPSTAQTGLNETLKLQNYFLACACKPEQDMDISLPQESFAMEVPVTVVSVEQLNVCLLSISLQCEQAILDYKSGQSAILLNSDNFGSKCAIVSPSNTRLSGQLEVHLELSHDACFSKWAATKLCAGIRMRLYGPIGNMIYLATTANQTLLLAGKNEGLSYLVGIVQDIFSREHKGKIYLFHQVDSTEDLYLSDELNEIGSYYPNFHYIPCVLQSSENEVASHRIKQTITNLTGARVFISGCKDFVHTIQKQSFLAGCRANDIFVEVTK
jgi:NAD(P)H-flavin reductase/ferredoxin